MNFLIRKNVVRCITSTPTLLDTVMHNNGHWEALMYKSYLNVKQRIHVPKAVLIADNASIKHRKQTKLQVTLQRSSLFKKVEKF